MEKLALSPLHQIQAKTPKQSKQLKSILEWMQKNWLLMLILLLSALLSSALFVFCLPINRFFTFLTRPSRFFKNGFIIAVFVLLCWMELAAIGYLFCNKLWNFFRIAVLSFAFIMLFLLSLTVFHSLWLSVCILAGVTVLHGMLFFQKDNSVLMLLYKTLLVALAMFEFSMVYVLYLLN